MSRSSIKDMDIDIVVGQILTVIILCITFVSVICYLVEVTKTKTKEEELVKLEKEEELVKLEKKYGLQSFKIGLCVKHKNMDHTYLVIRNVSLESSKKHKQWVYLVKGITCVKKIHNRNEPQFLHIYYYDSSLVPQNELESLNKSDFAQITSCKRCTEIIMQMSNLNAISFPSHMSKFEPESYQKEEQENILDIIN